MGYSLNLASAGGAARADIADSASWDIAAATDLLLLAAIKKTATDSGTFIFGKQDHYWFETDGSGQVRGKFNHSVDGIQTLSSTAVPTIDTWEWLILSYDYSAGEAAVFLAGTRISHITGISVSGGVSDAGSSGFSLGDPSGISSHQCYIDEVYVSTDITGYSPASSSVSDPSGTFSADGNTVALYHMDSEGGTGTTVTDSGGSALDLSFASSPRDPSWSASGEEPWIVAASTSNLLLLGVG